MSAGLTSFNTPVPELPVVDVERAQAHYRDTFGFQVGWIQPGWVHAPEIDTTYAEMKASGARIVEPLETKPWGLRQFTVEDLDRNRFYFHCD